MEIGRVMLDKKKDNLIELDIRVDKKKFSTYQEDGVFGIYEVQLINKRDMSETETTKNDDFVKKSEEFVIISGVFDKILIKNEEYLMYGNEVVHKTYGKQFKIQFINSKTDTGVRIKSFLSGIVADSISQQLIDKYGDEVLNVIAEDKVDYSDIHGMAEHRYTVMREKVIENIYMKNMIMDLHGLGITTKQMKLLAKKFGANAINVVKENPYRLCEIHGIGFTKADEVAKTLNFPMDSPFRINEATKYCLEEMELGGDCWIVKKNLINNVIALTDIDKKKIVAQFEKVPDIIILEDGRVALERTYEAEKEISSFFVKNIAQPFKLDFDMDNFIERQSEKRGIQLTEEQKSFFYKFKENRINLLVGNAGAGKSAIQAMLNDLAMECRLTPLFLAPTGKAAKVLTEYIGKEAFTIHRALKIIPGSDGVEKTYADLIVVDESSMVDIFLLKRLVESIANPNFRLILIGDDYQIPSVGVGNVLHDLIESEVVPLTRLTKVFRQAEGGLLDVVTKVRLNDKFLANGFDGEKKFGKDMILRSVSQSYMQDAVSHYYKKALNTFDKEEIIILSPTKKGNLGTVALNAIIQELVNPQNGSKNEIKHGFDTIFREGDRVINIKNQYNMPTMKEIDLSYDFDQDTPEDLVTVVNGDIGKIESIKDGKIVIDFGFAKIQYLLSGLDSFLHAYCLSVHRSQGSGFKCVIFVTDKAHTYQMNSNLLYTGMTRAKEMCVLICQSDVVNLSMNKNANLTRNTFLKDLIHDAASSQQENTQEAV